MERLSMRKIREVLRLTFEVGLSARQIAESLHLARSTVGECLRRFRESGLPWPLPSELGDVALELRLFPPAVRGSGLTRSRPDWAKVHQELKRKGVTLALLWQEYKLAHPDGYQYSRFCDQYRGWVGRQDVVMRQTHRAGEKLFVDYTGQPAEVIDRTTGEIRPVQVFVAVLGASNDTYAEATWTQQLPDWIGAHVRAFAFFGGVPEMLISDNLKSGVTKAHRYEPDLRRSGPALWGHGLTGAVTKTARQGQGRGRGANRRTLDFGGVTPSAVLLLGRTQPSHPRTAPAAEPAPLQETTGLTTDLVHHPGATRVAPVALHPL